MANTNEQTLSIEAEDALLNDDHDPKEKTPTTARQDPIFSMLQNVNKTLGTMADSILNLNQSLKRLHPSNTDDQLDPKRRKYSSKDEMSASDGSDEDGDDSDAELQALCGTEADKTSKINHMLDSSKATAAMTHCCRKSQKIFSMQTNQVRLLRNNWLTLLTTCGLRNCQTQN